MDYRQLRYFIAVAEELSFSRAAKRLHVSQPPLSTQIKAMEEELGTQLLSRTRRAVALTQAGQLLLEHARRAVSELDLPQLVARRLARKERQQRVHHAHLRKRPPILRRGREDELAGLAKHEVLTPM